MNLSNISAITIGVPIENLPEKIADIQAVKFAVESLQPTAEGLVMIRARLIKEGDPKQSIGEVQKLMDDFMRHMQQARDVKKDPYVW